MERPLRLLNNGSRKQGVALSVTDPEGRMCRNFSKCPHSCGIVLRASPLCPKSCTKAALKKLRQTQGCISDSALPKVLSRLLFSWASPLFQVLIDFSRLALAGPSPAPDSVEAGGHPGMDMNSRGLRASAGRKVAAPSPGTSEASAGWARP